MKVRILPALEDNLMYLLMDETRGVCAAVDPVEPEKLLAAVKEEGVKLTHVLTTHHHWDHSSGNATMAEKVQGLAVLGGDDRIPALTQTVSHEQQLQLGQLQITCLSTPCHTSGHICYYVTGASGEDPLVFTGDTLFQAGCGRFFEGSPEQMHSALNLILAKLPSDTRVYCGHEYTVNNLRFAAHVEPSNSDVQKRLTWAQKERAAGRVTIPSSIAEELSFNPFMRVGCLDVQSHTKCQDPVKVMAALRKEKDSFKPKM